MGRTATAVALLVTAVALALAPSGALAQQSGEDHVIEGAIENGTGGIYDTSGLRVVLHTSGAETANVETTTDSEGRFRFGGVLPDPGVSYTVSTQYQGAIYATTTNSATSTTTLTVYEATSDVETIEVANASLLLASVDKDTQTLWAFEIIAIANRTDRTYVPGPSPMSLLRFALPDAAVDLQVDTDLLGADLLQVDLGFAMTAAVPPGRHDVMFAYSFPYSGRELELARSYPYGADAARVLVPYEVARLAAGGFASLDEVDVGGRIYQQLSASNVPRGARPSVILTDLPRASALERLGDALAQVRPQYFAPAGLLVMMGVLVAIGLWTRRRGPGMSAILQSPATPPASARRRVLDMMSRVEEDFARGALSEVQYERRRSLLAARLTNLSE